MWCFALFFTIIFVLFPYKIIRITINQKANTNVHSKQKYKNKKKLSRTVAAHLYAFKKYKTNNKNLNTPNIVYNININNTNSFNCVITKQSTINISNFKIWRIQLYSKLKWFFTHKFTTPHTLTQDLNKLTHTNATSATSTDTTTDIWQMAT